MIAKDDVLLIPAPTPHRNFQTNDNNTNQSLLSTKSSKPRPTMDTIWHEKSMKVMIAYNKEAA
jgi:hypothetical protein